LREGMGVWGLWRLNRLKRSRWILMMLCKSTLYSCVAPEDELISRDLRPILSPEDAQAIQRLVKGQKSRSKPYMKKYSGGILDDPILKKWTEEDSNLKVPILPRLFDQASIDVLMI
jgi:hypothetical protein